MAKSHKGEYRRERSNARHAVASRITEHDPCPRCTPKLYARVAALHRGLEEMPDIIDFAAHRTGRNK